MITDTIGIWLNIIITLACISFAFKENPLYRFAQATAVGIATGNVAILAIGNIQKHSLKPMSEGAYLFAIPFILGVLLYTRVHSKTAWISRYPIMLLLGIGTGLAVRGTIPAQIIAQIEGTILPMNVNNLILIILVTSVLVFFIFTWEPKGEQGKKIMEYIRRLGRITIMIYLGANFSSAAMARIIVMAERFMFILTQGLGLVV